MLPFPTNGSPSKLRTTTANPQRILASGRVAQDLPSWLQVLADVLGAPVEPVTLKRATLRGTALHAVEVLAPDTPRAAVRTAPAVHPVPEHAAYYRDRAEQYDRLYRAVLSPDRTLQRVSYGSTPQRSKAEIHKWSD